MQQSLIMPFGTCHMVYHIALYDVGLQGTSRGGADVKEIVKRIDLWGLNMVFVVGGNGGNAAAHAIAEECEAQVGYLPCMQ